MQNLYQGTVFTVKLDFIFFDEPHGNLIATLKTSSTIMAVANQKGLNKSCFPSSRFKNCVVNQLSDVRDELKFRKDGH